MTSEIKKQRIGIDQKITFTALGGALSFLRSKHIVGEAGFKKYELPKQQITPIAKGKHASKAFEISKPNSYNTVSIVSSPFRFSPISLYAIFFNISSFSCFYRLSPRKTQFFADKSS